MRIPQTILLLSLALFSPGAFAAELLTVGSDAPPLDIEHWVQNGNGKFKPVTKFEDGKVYVVEFWATWCGPCIQSMPHLAALQKEYADQGVQIVSISDEDLETVTKFLEREVRGGGGHGAGQDSGENAGEDGEELAKQTYQQLTSAYCLTTDPDGSSYEDYMQAAAQNGIPTAFIVGKDSKVEWLGHPMEMDGPLQAIVAGSWDREKFAKEIKARQEAEKAMQEIFALLQEQDFKGALKLLDETIAKGGDQQQLNMLKLQVLIVSGDLGEANQHLSSLYTKLADEPKATEMIAWNIYEMTAQGRVPKGELLTTSITAVKAAADKAPADQKASILDTFAHLVFVSGDVDQAIAIESEALKLAGPRDRDFINNFMKELQQAKQSGEKKEKEQP